MIAAPSTVCTALRHYSKRQLREIFGKSAITIHRWSQPRSAKNPWGGTLPRPCGCVIGGCNAWDADEVDARRPLICSQPKRSFPRGVEANGRRRGHSLRDDFAELKTIAAEALVCAGVNATGTVLARYAPSGRLTDVPVDSRRAAIMDLRRLAERYS